MERIFVIYLDNFLVEKRARDLRVAIAFKRESMRFSDIRFVP